MAIDLEKYRKPQPTRSVDLSKYRKQQGSFRYAQPVDRQERIQSAQNDAQAAGIEAQKANSFGGMLKNFGKGIVETIMPSETGLGKTIASIANPVNKNLEAANQEGTRIQSELVKRIRDNRQAGKDTGRLEQSFNRLANQTEADQKNIARELPSNKKVLAQVAGTGLDIISAGTYGRAQGALAGMKTGQLAPKVSTLPTAVQGLINTASRPAGLFTAKGAGRVAGGTALGYGFDVTQGLQGERGADREGVNALIPGVGTAVGFALPAATEGVQSMKNVFTKQGRIDRNITKRYKGVEDLGRRYVRVDAAFAAAEKKGVDVKRILSETDLLNGAVDADGMISSDKALANFDNLISPYENRVREYVVKEGRKITTNDIARQADEFMKTTRLLGDDRTQLENKIFSELQAFTKESNAVPVEMLHDRKVQLGSRINYMDPDKNAITKEVTRFFKELVENNTSSMNVKNHNSELSNLYSIRDALEALDKTRVKGARLGKYFSSVVGGVAGGAAGGPIGVIAGAEAGAAAQGFQLSRALGGDVPNSLKPSENLIKALAPKATGRNAIPDVIMPKARQGIPDVQVQSSNRGSLNMPQSTSANRPSAKSGVIPLSISSTDDEIKTRPGQKKRGE